MIIGFTGTRHGLTELQETAMRALLAGLTRKETVVAHHGDCIGADAAFDRACVDFHIERIVHPPTDDRLRAYCQGEIILTPRAYLQRNRDIVDATNFLIAVPDSHTEHLRSGTWSTIRYAVRARKHHTIVFPCGSTGSLQPIQT